MATRRRWYTLSLRTMLLGITLLSVLFAWQFYYRARKMREARQMQTLLAERGITPSAVTHVVHGTTLITNAIIERKGAKTGLITTKGFRDALEIGRDRRHRKTALDASPKAASCKA